MFYVYLIQSEAFPDQRYVGFSTDLKERLKTHNAGGSVHTSKYKPWRLVSYHAFADKRKAQEFEYYLKSGSGRAFANKRFWGELGIDGAKNLRVKPTLQANITNSS